MKYFPFIHKIKKKKIDTTEPLPLYIELEQLPPPQKVEESKDPESERGVIIIDLL